MNKRFPSPWFMWFVGYSQAFSYFTYFQPNGYIWQFLIFVAIGYTLSYVGWRFWHE